MAAALSAADKDARYRKGFEMIKALTQDVPFMASDFSVAIGGEPLEMEQIALLWPIKDRVFALLFSLLNNPVYLPVQRQNGELRDGVDDDSEEIDPLTGETVSTRSRALKTREIETHTLTSFNLVTPFSLVYNGKEEISSLVTQAAPTEAGVRNRVLRALLMKQELDDPIIQYNMMVMAMEQAPSVTTIAPVMTRVSNRAELTKIQAVHKALQLSRVSRRTGVDANYALTILEMDGQPLAPTTKSGPGPSSTWGNHTITLSEDEGTCSASLMDADKRVAYLEGQLEAAVTDRDKEGIKDPLQIALRVQAAVWAAYSDLCAQFLRLVKWNEQPVYPPPTTLCSIDPKLKATLTPDQQRVIDLRVNLLQRLKPFQFSKFIARLTKSLQAYRLAAIGYVQRKLCTPTAELEFELYADMAGVDVARKSSIFVSVFKSLCRDKLKIENIEVRRTIGVAVSLGKEAAVLRYRAVVRIGARGMSNSMEDVDRDVMRFEQLLDPQVTRQRPEMSNWKIIGRFDPMPLVRNAGDTGAAPNFIVRYIGRVETVHDDNLKQQDKKMCLPRNYTHLPGYATRISAAEASSDAPSKGHKRDVARDALALREERTQLLAAIEREKQRFLAASVTASREDMIQLHASFKQNKAALETKLRGVEDRIKPLSSEGGDTVIAVGKSEDQMLADELQGMQETRRSAASSSSAFAFSSSPTTRQQQQQQPYQQRLEPRRSTGAGGDGFRQF